MFYQSSLLSIGEPSFDAAAGPERIALDERSWVDVAPGWLRGSDTVFDELDRVLPWRQRCNVAMYDQLVDEPRLTAWWSADHGEPEAMPVLGEIRAALAERYRAPFDSIGYNLYRDGRDSVAWHGDRHRHHVVDPVVAIVSVGERRPLRLRPRRDAGGTGASRVWLLGRGDLFVMGGACQHEWEHCVPKLRRAGPRISITFRHDAQRSSSSDTSVGAEVP